MRNETAYYYRLHISMVKKEITQIILQTKFDNFDDMDQ